MSSDRKPILVGTDLNPRSDRAVDRAEFLARSWQVPLKVFHAIEPGSKFEDTPELAEQAVRAILPDPKAGVDILVLRAASSKGLVATSEATGCGLIVTGTAKYDTLSDYLFGSTVDYAIKYANVPVLIVKQRNRGPYRSLLVASDFSTCSRSALIAAAQLFPDAAIHLVNAHQAPIDGSEPSDVVLRNFRKQLKGEAEAFLSEASIPQEIRNRVFLHLEEGKLEEVVQRVATAVQADLVVIGPHRRRGFARLFTASSTDWLLAWTQQDTLVVRDNLAPATIQT